MSAPYLNLTSADFDAYLPERATSNAYTRPRIEVKQRALVWSRRVLGRLDAMGMAVDAHGSDEHPSVRNRRRVDCQWIFFWRNQDARDELDRLLDRGRPLSADLDDPIAYTRHAFLALRVDAEGVEVCFALHPEARVDVDNLRARLESARGAGDAALAREFTSALEALPQEFRIGVGSDRVPADSAPAERVLEMLRAAAAGEVPLRIGWIVPRDVALTHADILDEQLEDALVALAPIYKLVAWSRDNDHIALDRRLEGIERERAQTHAEIEAETARWRAEREAERERSLERARARRPTLDTLFKPRSDGARLESKRARPAEPPQPTAARGDGAARAEPPRATASGSNGVDKGARVLVLSGPFANKEGVVSELDGRGGARVLLGLLSTRIDVAELAPALEPARPALRAAAHGAPALQSSHRRPADPRKTR